MCSPHPASVLPSCKGLARGRLHLRHRFLMPALLGAHAVRSQQDSRQYPTPTRRAGRCCLASVASVSAFPNCSAIASGPALSPLAHSHCEHTQSEAERECRGYGWVNFEPRKKGPGFPDLLASRRNSMSPIDRFCVRYRSQISEKRVARGSCFCSDECRCQDKIERRRARAQKYCRLCHRGLPGQKTPKTTGPVASVEITHCAPGAHPPLS